MLQQLGLTDPQARAERILALETALAKSHATDADTADAFKANNPWRRSDFDAKAPGMDWAAFLHAAGLDGQDSFIVWQPGAVSGVAELVASQPLDGWKDYLTFHLIEHHAAVLPKPYRDLYLGYRGQDPADSAQAETRALAMTQASLGEPVGQIYVQRYFPPSAKEAAQAMVATIRTAFRAHLAQMKWMDPQTRAKAIAKLDAIDIGLGYPDHWIDFSTLEVVRGDAIGNLRRAEAFQYRHELGKLKLPVDIGEWFIVPQSVGAVINFNPNSYQFGAGLLQPPFFDPDGDAASNYGSAGAGLAHEIAHSFDELGNIYDAQGRLQPSWWTPEDLARYKAAAAPMIAQFNAYCPQADLCVRGEQTLGENINDLGGLKIAHDAYLLSLKGKPDLIKDGLTGEQRFFLAYARRWRTLQTSDSLRHQILTDTHSPGPYRSDTVRNLDAWYRAFDVKPTDKLYLRPEDRVEVW
jgi:predicted metalloendopeptidase